MAAPLLFCRECGRMRRPVDHACSACGSLAPASTTWIRPSVVISPDRVTPPPPWKAFNWEHGGTAIFSADPGIGKTTLLLLLNQPSSGTKVAGIISLEQNPDALAKTAQRVGLACPDVVSIPLDSDNKLAVVRQRLYELSPMPGSIVGIDSITELGPEDGLTFMREFIAYCRRTGVRGLVISQKNKEGKVAGKAALPFLVDVELEGYADDMGRRVLRARKNRFGPLFWSYYLLTKNGFEQPNFTRIAHTVEGDFPDYELVPYGMAVGSIAGAPGRARGKTLQLAGVLDALAEKDLLKRYAGYASAAIQSYATETGFYFPDDEPARRELAEEHGLKWLGEAEVRSILPDWAHELQEKRKKRNKTTDGDGDTDGDLP